jgi:hypothetical protein
MGRKQQAAAAQQEADAGEADAGAGLSPVALVIFKRQRAARKKLNRANELMASVASGKELTEEQVRHRLHGVERGRGTETWERDVGKESVGLSVGVI